MECWTFKFYSFAIVNQALNTRKRLDFKNIVLKAPPKEGGGFEEDEFPPKLYMLKEILT